MALFISHKVMHLIKSAYYIALLWSSCPEQTHLSGLIKVMLEVLSKSCKKGLALALALLLVDQTHSFKFSILHFTTAATSTTSQVHTREHLRVGEIMKQPNDVLKQIKKIFKKDNKKIK